MIWICWISVVANADGSVEGWEESSHLSSPLSAYNIRPLLLCISSFVKYLPFFAPLANYLRKYFNRFIDYKIVFQSLGYWESLLNIKKEDLFNSSGWKNSLFCVKKNEKSLLRQMGRVRSDVTQCRDNQPLVVMSYFNENSTSFNIFSIKH